MSSPYPVVMGELTEQDRDILDFEHRAWRYWSAQLDAIEQVFAMAFALPVV